MLHSPAAWQPHPGVLRGQPGEVECSLRWWQHWQRRRTAAAAGQSLLSPVDWRCVELSGRPTQMKKVTLSLVYYH